jgi:exodeoxyribonuclease III
MNHLLLRLTILLCACSPPLLHATEEASLKILTYNVLYGFNHQKATDVGAAWIKGQQADLVALQEMNTYTQDKLTNLAKKWDHPHSVILKEKGFPVALTSKTPIEVIEKRLQGMWHGYLHCKVNGTHIFVVHLSPSKHDVRVREAGILAAKIQPLLAAKERVIVLGDFNCNSPLDKSWLEERQSTDEWRKKSPENADPGYVTMNKFLSLGLVDLVHSKQAPDKVQLGTFPTNLINPSRPGHNWRIDFILTDPLLAKSCTNASTLRDDAVHKISDHFPVQATFTPNPQR